MSKFFHVDSLIGEAQQKVMRSAILADKSFYKSACSLEIILVIPLSYRFLTRWPIGFYVSAASLLHCKHKFCRPSGEISYLFTGGPFWTYVWQIVWYLWSTNCLILYRQLLVSAVHWHNSGGEWRHSWGKLSSIFSPKRVWFPPKTILHFCSGASDFLWRDARPARLGHHHHPPHRHPRERCHRQSFWWDHQISCFNIAILESVVFVALMILNHESNNLSLLIISLEDLVDKCVIRDGGEIPGCGQKLLQFIEECEHRARTYKMRTLGRKI